MLHKNLSANWNINECSSFQQCINIHHLNPFEDITHNCTYQHCDRYLQPSSRQCQYENSPRIIMHMLDWDPPANFMLDNVVTFNNHDYRIFAGIYTSGADRAHFVARIRRGEYVYYYDGMMNRAATSSRCTQIPVTETPFPAHIPAEDGGPLHMLAFIYIRVT